MNFLDSNELDLNSLRQVLVRLEDSIIFALIERAQFGLNSPIYTSNDPQFHKLDFDGCFVQFLLYEMEKIHSKVRRYTSPDEYPFSNRSSLPLPILPPLKYSHYLHEAKINMNDEIYERYVKEIVPSICTVKDDNNYGSSATRDVECLQVLSRRIHYGKFIAEVKFRDPRHHETYVKLIKSNDADGIFSLLTDEKVEERLLKRLKLKALSYGREIDVDLVDSSIEDERKINSDTVVRVYRDFVIPLTKKVEVEYLLSKKSILVSETCDIPSIDLVKLSMDPTSKDFQEEVEKLGRAAMYPGFFTAKNHELPTSEMFQLTREFFLKTANDVKTEFKSVKGAHGYISPDQELLDTAVADPKEAFNFRFPMPDILPPLFEVSRDKINDFQRKCHNVGLKILSGLSAFIGKDASFFPSRHSPDLSSHSTLRFLRYMPVESGQRAGLHSDYGSLTLLLSTASGLQIFPSSNTTTDQQRQFLDVPLTNDVIVNIGDLMQYWTDSFFTSTLHRVVSKPDAPGNRFSIAYFMHPNNDVQLDIVSTPRISTESSQNRQVERQKMQELCGNQQLYTASSYLEHRLNITHDS